MCFDETARAFPTIGTDGRDVRLLGVRSKTPVEALPVRIGGYAALLPLHKIMSEKPARESLLDERYEGEIAVITCSSFVGDSDEALNRLYETGKSSGTIGTSCGIFQPIRAETQSFQSAFCQACTAGSAIR